MMDLSKSIHVQKVFIAIIKILTNHHSHFLNANSELHAIHFAQDHGYLQLGYYFCRWSRTIKIYML